MSSVRRATALAAALIAVLLAPAAASAAPPSNDNRANASVLTGLTPSVSGTNVEATVEGDEPEHLAGVSAVASVWYRWDAPATGTVTWDVCTSDFDTILAAYA